MFVRKKSSPSNPNTYIQLIESYRVDGKPRQKVIKHIGTASEPEKLNKLMELGEQLKILYETNSSQTEIDTYYDKEISKINSEASPSILNCERINTKITGIHDIYGNILNQFNLKEIFGKQQKYYNIFFDSIMSRISNPSSKRMSVQTLEKDFGIIYPLHSIYRMMDKIDDQAISDIQHKISVYNEKLLGGTINVLFYDVTTIYFESFTSDDLKSLVYSKDNKFNQPQIVLTLLVSEQGLPLGYQLFPGNTYEGNTLLTAIEQWRNNYKNSKFVLVADSGMLNKTNLSTLDKKGISYIVCSRMKNLPKATPKATKEEILSLKESMMSGNDFYHSIKFGTRQLIISYKLSRAKKDRYDREKAVESLCNKLKTNKNPTSLISNYGYKKFITVNNKSKIDINEEKIIESERWDGLHGIITNIKDINPRDAYAYYKNLWQVEDAFRINKSDLKIRPIFHWTENRVRSHVLMSYVSYACYKAVEFIVNKDNDTKLSHREIRSLLKHVDIEFFKDKYSDNYYALPRKLTKGAKKIYSLFKKPYDDIPYRCTAEMSIKS